MDKNFMIFMALGVGALYYVTNKVSAIQENDPAIQTNEYKEKHQFDEYQKVDSIGQNILDVTDISLTEQMKAWDNSPLKQEALSQFPDFIEMKSFIKERVRGDSLISHLTTAIDKIQADFFAGAIDAESAKRRLGKIK